MCLFSVTLGPSPLNHINTLLVLIYKISNSIIVLLVTYVLVYLTSSVKHRLFSFGVDVKKESGDFAQLLLYLPSLILFLTLTVL